MHVVASSGSSFCLEVGMLVHRGPGLSCEATDERALGPVRYMWT
jgi:hypothetical protein